MPEHGDYAFAERMFGRKIGGSEAITTKKSKDTKRERRINLIEQHCHEQWKGHTRYPGKPVPTGCVGQTQDPTNSQQQRHPRSRKRHPRNLRFRQ